MAGPLEEGEVCIPSANNHGTRPQYETGSFHSWALPRTRDTLPGDPGSWEAGTKLQYETAR